MFQVHSHFLRVIPEIGWYDLGYDSNFDRSAKSTATVWFALFRGRFVAKSLVRRRNDQAIAICSCKLALSPVTVLASPKVNAFWNVSGGTLFMVRTHLLLLQVVSSMTQTIRFPLCIAVTCLMKLR